MSTHGTKPRGDAIGEDVRSWTRSGHCARLLTAFCRLR
jgi:hypothetical protein